MSKRARPGSALAIVAVACIVTLALSLEVVGAEAAPSFPVRAGAGPGGARSSVPAGVDLDVTYINRSPLYKAYCVGYPWDVPGRPGIPFLCPGIENDRRWPEPGEIVTLTAHIVNEGTTAGPAFGYTWHLDGIEVANDGWGNLVVADAGHNRVVVLTPEGEFLAEFTEPDEGDTGPFTAPPRGAVEPDGDLVVADTGNGRVVTVHSALPGLWRIWLPLLARVKLNDRPVIAGPRRGNPHFTYQNQLEPGTSPQLADRPGR